MARKKILITGGNSTLGSHLKPFLSKAAEVITMGRRGCDIMCDLSPSGEDVSLPGVDVVIHTAARFRGASDRDFLDTIAVNVLGTVKICQMAIAARATHVVIISSAYASLSPSSPHYSVYSLSKRQAEEAALLYCLKHAMPLAILRPSQLYGGDNRFRRHQPFFYNIIDKARAGEDIVFFGTHDARRNYLHVDDLCQAIEGVVTESLTGTFACMQPRDVTFSEIAHAAIEAFKSLSNVRFDPARDNIPDNTLPADNTLYERLGCYPKVSLAEGMTKIAERRRHTPS
jgi:nucleoside-diphosphate-sugar epimerase